MRQSVFGWFVICLMPDNLIDSTYDTSNTSALISWKFLFFFFNWITKPIPNYTCEFFADKRGI